MLKFVLKEVFSISSYFFDPHSLASWYGLSGIIAGIYSFPLGIFVLIKNRKILGVSLFALTFTCGMWLIFMGLGSLARTAEVAHFWFRSVYFWVFLINPGALFVSSCITGLIKVRRERTILYAGYIIMFLCSFITILFPETIVVFPPREYAWGYDGHAGILLLPFLIPWAALALKATYDLYVAYKKTPVSLEKRKMRIFLFAYILGYVGSVDILGDFGIPVYPFGYLFIVTYISLLAYNMIKYKAFEVETVIHRTLLWLLASGSILVPVILAVYLTRPFLARMNAVTLGILMTALFFTFKYYHARLQPKIDHIFRRRRYDYSQILSMLSLSLKGVLDVKKLSQEVSRALKEALYLQKIGVVIKDIKTENLIVLVEEGFTNNIPSVSVKDSVVQYLHTHTHVEPELIKVDPTLSYLQGSPLYEFIESGEVPLVLSLALEEDFIGFIVLGKKQNLIHYASRDIEILENIASEISLYFYNALHHQDILEKQRLEQEIILARNIQENLLPQKPPLISGLSVYGLYSPSKEIGGDYYDFIVQETGDNKVYITIGDVSGKGLDAGLVVSSVKSFLVSFVRFYDSPRQILNILNQDLYKSLSQQKFISLLLLQHVPLQNTITYSSAGHEHILLYRVSQQKEKNAIETIKSGGVILGMVDNIEEMLEEHTITLDRGDKIILYTDGVTEARNVDEDFFGLGRLIESFRKHAHLPIKEVVTGIHEDIETFISTREQYDDITLVGIEKE